MFNQFLEDVNKKIINILFCALTLFLAVLVVSRAIDIKDKVQNPVARSTISVSDKGTIYTKPDLALDYFSVITEAKTVAEALSQNTEKMNAVIDGVKKIGVEEKDLKTINFSIYPRYEWPSQNDPYQGERILAGYEITQSLEVKIRNLEKVGEIIQAATGAGANESGSLQFQIENQDEIKNQARAEAIKKAKAKAKDLASQLGVGLGKIMYFDESGANPYYYSAEKTTNMGGGESPQIETGENKIEVTVTITYEIR